LCDVISEKAANEEFSHILLEVNNRMADKEKVISSFECQLRKKLYLAKKNNIFKKVFDNGRYEGEMKGDKRMDKVFFILITVIVMTVIGKTTKEMEKVFIILITVIVMTVIGKTTKKMEKVFIIIITVIVMTVIGKTTK
jgi:hypothetical protein